uniref:Uncharacterized protein n=1 Tax=Physcomitrium patens TaxID=3218 RepID=A0A2K1JM21_PHYPA|nr:hypothetical protein PHYPA_017427 [Physcomitrium patens]
MLHHEVHTTGTRQGMTTSWPGFGDPNLQRDPEKGRKESPWLQGRHFVTSTKASACSWPASRKSRDSLTPPPSTHTRDPFLCRKNSLPFSPVLATNTPLSCEITNLFRHPLIPRLLKFGSPDAGCALKSSPAGLQQYKKIPPLSDLCSEKVVTSNQEETNNQSNKYTHCRSLYTILTAAPSSRQTHKLSLIAQLFVPTHPCVRLFASGSPD